VHREDVGVLQPRSEVDFALEPLGAKCRGQLGMEDLERNGSIVLQIAGEVDCSHPPAPELALDRVAVGQRRSQEGRNLG